MSKAPHSLIGRVIAGKIRIETLIGQGAMGAVYAGRHMTLDESVAVKVMHPELAADPAFPERFRREATTMVKLKHPGVVRVLDFGEEPDGLLYLVMELVEGRNLAALMAAEWPLSPVRSANLLRQVLAAVQTAHMEGIVHRDLKPENILVVRSVNEDGDPVEVTKVCDFGIAKIRDPRSERTPGFRAPALTTAGLVVGTPEYMSPEQARAEVLDARSDVYSVGVILYEMLARSVPFEAESAIGVVLRHISEPPEPPSKRTPDVDRMLEAICLRAMRKAPDDRYQTARDMRAALREVDPAPNERPIPPSIQARRVAGTLASLQLDVRPGSVAPSVSSATLAAVGHPTSRSRGRASWGIIAASVAMGAVGLGVAARYRSEGTPLVEAAAFSLPAIDTSIAPPSTQTALVSAPPATVAPTGDRSAPAPLARNDAPPPTAAPLVATTQVAPASTTVKTASPSADPPVSAAPIVAAAPPVTVAPTTTPAPTTPPAPAFDVASARASIAGVGSTEGVLKSAVANALGRTTGAMTACYRSQLTSMTTPVSGRASLHVETDGSGNVIRASANVPFAPTIAGCVERAVRGARFSGVDTGEATADITLSFEVD